MNGKLALTVVTFCVWASACAPGPLGKVTGTPSPTAISIPTLTTAPASTAAPAPTETPTATATAAATATPVGGLLLPALTCPKGTTLNLTFNKCFYATRTPKPQINACYSYKSKAACISNGCGWNKKVGICTP